MSKSNRDRGPCYLQSFPTSNGLERALSRVLVFEEEIARQRVEEHLRLCGSRPELTDAVDIDKPNQLAFYCPVGVFRSLRPPLIVRQKCVGKERARTGTIEQSLLWTGIPVRLRQTHGSIKVPFHGLLPS